MALAELGEPLRPDVIPLPVKNSPPNKFVDDVIIMARLVDNFYSSRGLQPVENEHTTALQKVTLVMKNEKLSIDQRRIAVAQMFGLKLSS